MVVLSAYCNVSDENCDEYAGMGPLKFTAMDITQIHLLLMGIYWLGKYRVCPGSCSGIDGDYTFPYDDIWSDNEIWPSFGSESCFGTDVGPSTWSLFAVCPTGTRLLVK